jgi:hypothetical protein
MVSLPSRLFGLDIDTFARAFFALAVQADTDVLFVVSVVRVRLEGPV